MPSNQIETAVRYLSQKFVERLCAEDQIGAELIQEIEAVIFSYIDPTDTFNASSFDELRSLHTEGIRAEGDRLREDMIRLTREECALRENLLSFRKESAHQNPHGRVEWTVEQFPKAAWQEKETIKRSYKANART